MKKMVTKKRILSFLCMSLLFTSHTMVHPRNSTLEKVALGGLAAVGGAALGCLAWNSSYYNAESCIESANQRVRDGHVRYDTILRLCTFSHKAAVLQEIRKSHRASCWNPNMRSRYWVLGFVDRLRDDIDALEDCYSRLRSYAKSMQDWSLYYGKLSEQRIDIQNRVKSLLSQLRELLQSITNTQEYQHQEYEYKRAVERNKITQFKRHLRDAQSSLRGIATDFAREYEQLTSFTMTRFVEECLCAIIRAKFSCVSCCGSTSRSNYAALWYEEKLLKAIRKLERTQRDLHREHAQVRLLSCYNECDSLMHEDHVEYEYSNFMAQITDQLVKLRNIRDRLPSTVFYISDLRAYQAACHEHRVRVREQSARERERAAEHREWQARERECEARQREYNARLREQSVQEEEQRQRAEQARLTREREQAAYERERLAQQEQENRCKERELKQQERAAREREKKHAAERQRKAEQKARKEKESSKKDLFESDLYHDVVSGW